MTERVVSAIEEAADVEEGPEGRRALLIVRALAKGASIDAALAPENGEESIDDLARGAVALGTLFRFGAVEIGPRGRGRTSLRERARITDKGRRIAAVVEAIDGGRNA